MLGSLIGTKRIVWAAAFACIWLAALTGSADALSPSPKWELTSVSGPRNFLPKDKSGRDQFVLTGTNVGDATTVGAIAITETLPKGLTAVSLNIERGSENLSCSPLPARTINCTLNETIEPAGHFALTINVDVEAVEAGIEEGSEITSHASVSGGGTTEDAVDDQVKISSMPAGFGIESLGLTVANQDGTPDTQAGSHPYELTTAIRFNQTITAGGSIRTEGLVKDLHFELPPGLIGDPSAIPQCADAEFSTVNMETSVSECPNDTAIGVVEATTEAGMTPAAVYNLVPAVGEPARFGFMVLGVPVVLDTAVRTDGDYGVTVNVSNTPNILAFSSSRLTLWGVPADPSHDALRGHCIGLLQAEGTCPLGGGQPLVPFLTLPTSCGGGPLKAVVHYDSWEEPSTHREKEFELSGGTTGGPLVMDGCNRLPFQPELSVAPDSSAGSTPTGLNVELKVPQEIDLNPTGLAESDVKSTTVALPEGVLISPAGADGLQACSPAQITINSPGAPTCPDASKIGTVEINSPLLPEPLIGAAYLSTQGENPFGSLVAMYIVAEDKQAGVLVKLAGEVSLNEPTGRLVSTFKNTPQLPFSDLKLNFFGGARAPLTTPPLCGTYTTEASIEPWSGNPAAHPSSSFRITAGPGGSPCTSPLPFGPGFTAGSTKVQAGAFSPLTATVTRPDADQALGSISLESAPGLEGTLTSVKLCPEPQASQGECGEESLIGHTTVSAGLGSDPYTVTGGRMYITGPYKGAPFGLSIVDPAKAGPFDLEDTSRNHPPCDCIVVRAKVEVNPYTAQLKIVGDPLPTMLEGIPLQIQHVNVTADRPNFTFNPTNCNKLQIKGTMTSSQGASATVSSPFQVTDCAALKFNPKFAVSTGGHPSRANGTSLRVKLSYPKAPFGSQANIARVKVELPKQLPSRLKTLQKACTAAVFEANPAKCPAASVVGHAKVTTPVLPVPLVGPAYFVSHGGEAFPSLIVVLQGYGVTVDLVGSTFISKKGITSSTFKTVPDVPVGTFELTLPPGGYSALTANGNLCKSKSKLVMPTTFTAQDGAVLHQDTKIGVTGCPKPKKARAKRRK